MKRNLVVKRVIRSCPVSAAQKSPDFRGFPGEQVSDIASRLPSFDGG